MISKVNENIMNAKIYNKLEKSRTKFKRYCKCGHSIVFPKSLKRDKVICTHCGRYIFKNDLLEFEYRIKEKSKKV